MKKEKKIDIKEIIMREFNERDVEGKTKKLGFEVCEKFDNFIASLDDDKKIEFEKIDRLQSELYYLYETELVDFDFGFVRAIYK